MPPSKPVGDRQPCPERTSVVVDRGGLPNRTAAAVVAITVVVGGVLLWGSRESPPPAVSAAPTTTAVVSPTTRFHATTTSSLPPTTGGTIRVSVPELWEPSTAPGVSWTPGQFTQAAMVFDTLMVRGVSGATHPWLAAPYTTDDEHWSLVLPAGVQFHDGTPLTAQIVAGGLTAAARNPATPEAAAIVSAVPDGDLKVAVALRSPDPGFPGVLAGQAGIVSLNQTLGTGPFVVVAPGVYSRNSWYWKASQEFRSLPYVDQVRFTENDPYTDLVVAEPGANLRDMMAQTASLDQPFMTDTSWQSRLGQGVIFTPVVAADEPVSVGSGVWLATASLRPQ